MQSLMHFHTVSPHGLRSGAIGCNEVDTLLGMLRLCGYLGWTAEPCSNALCLFEQARADAELDADFDLMLNMTDAEADAFLEAKLREAAGS